MLGWSGQDRSLTHCRWPPVPRSVLASVWAMMAPARFRRAIKAAVPVRVGARPADDAGTHRRCARGRDLVCWVRSGERRRIVPAREIHVGEQAGGWLRTTWG